MCIRLFTIHSNELNGENKSVDIKYIHVKYLLIGISYVYSNLHIEQQAPFSLSTGIYSQ